MKIIRVAKELATVLLYLFDSGLQLITVLLKLNMLQSKRSRVSKLLETESETAYDHNSYMETKLNVSVSLKTNCKH